MSLYPGLLKPFFNFLDKLSHVYLLDTFRLWPINFLFYYFILLLSFWLKWEVSKIFFLE